MKPAYDIQGIMKLLPHRYPFLLVDRVIEVHPKEKVIALKNVTFNEPFFIGHFPNSPIMPGVLLIEAMGQAGGILAYESQPPEDQGKLIYFMGMDKVKFRKPVIPGDQVIFELEVLKWRRKIVKMAGKATVEGKLVAQAELMASYGETS